MKHANSTSSDLHHISYILGMPLIRQQIILQKLFIRIGLNGMITFSMDLTGILKVTMICQVLTTILLKLAST